MQWEEGGKMEKKTIKFKLSNLKKSLKKIQAILEQMIRVNTNKEIF